ncbi:glycerophosphodiester phosphodiesterase [Luteolibacter sp. GHJ8]|uniref:Glycerophosphodiester phosphodiesterase n=1 Tax=Luteolibacter rhizosphaerae TaxID=2989719 RepID=A0ABT3G3L3_9BACT|nr:glycerophosphodiester phosphodiesterase [Luteolibacter rhizosphaerae]MCW1914442.1 glycerophosphodiester phosphodiesterase [Luteolibacter rhizosphaerae]
MKILSATACSVIFSVMATAADLPLLVAHRGASHAAPENTLSAFKLAWEEGADGIEGDFYLSSDGEVVCIHDKDTKRTAGTALVVAETPWKELSKLDVGSWKSPEYKGERIPLLAEVLDVLPAGKRFFLEVKCGPEIVPALKKILAEKKADPARVTIISFNADVISESRKELPAYQAHWITDLKDFADPAKRESYEKQLGKCGSQGLQFKAASPVEGPWLASIKSKGLLLTSWTVDDATLAKKMIGFGVNHITTNRPGPLRKELAR